MTTLRTLALKAQKHSGKGAWTSRDRVVVGHVDTKCEKPFCVAHVDMEDELPVAAGVAIAAYIEAAQPSVVLGLLAEIERLTRENALMKRAIWVCPEDHGNAVEALAYDAPLPRDLDNSEAEDEGANA